MSRTALEVTSRTRKRRVSGAFPGVSAAFLVAIGFAVAAALGAPTQARAQQQVAGSPATAPETPLVSPRSAFLRSVLVPGWGQAVTGSHTRGGFYVAAQAGSLWMLWKSLGRKGEAERFADVERSAVRERLIVGGTTDPADVERAVEADPAVVGWAQLVDSRGQQVEDWIALSIFLVLMGGADAYVSAHLMDYPERLASTVLPGVDPERLSLAMGPADGSGGLSVALSLAVR